MTLRFDLYCNDLPSGRQEIHSFMADEDNPLLAQVNTFLDTVYKDSASHRYWMAYDDGEDLCSISSEDDLREAVSLQMVDNEMVKLVINLPKAPPA